MHIVTRQHAFYLTDDTDTVYETGRLAAVAELMR